MMIFLCLCCGRSTGKERTSAEPKGQCPDAAKVFHVQAGQQYEAQKEFGKAEREYLAAGDSSCMSVRQQALEGLKRIPSSAENELQVALFYESQGLWTEADAHFSKAAEGAESPSLRKSALDGLWRVRNAQSPRAHRSMNSTDFLTAWGAVVGRILAAVAVVWIVIVLAATMIGNQRALVVHPFEGEKEAATQASGAFPAVRCRVRAVFGGVFLPEVVAAVYPFVSPRLGELIPDEGFDIGGLKAQQVSYVVRLVARPRFEVYGGILKGESQGSHLVYAHVWRRRWWLWSRLAASVFRSVPVSDPNHLELQTFVYDVLLRAHESLGT